MGLIIIIILSIVGVAIFVLVIYKSYRSASRRFDNDKAFIRKNKKFKCASSPCEVIIDIDKSIGRFCEFHKRIQKYHLILISNKNKLQHKSDMYMNNNARMFPTANQKDKIYKEFKKEVLKYEKK